MALTPIQSKLDDPKTNTHRADKALPKAEALAGWEITGADLARARARWRRLAPEFEERIALAYTRRGIKIAAVDEVERRKL